VYRWHGLDKKDGDNLKTIQAVVHSLDGEKRKYHLEG
jgi:hypothetical protein